PRPKKAVIGASGVHSCSRSVPHALSPRHGAIVDSVHHPVISLPRIALVRATMGTENGWRDVRRVNGSTYWAGHAGSNCNPGSPPRDRAPPRDEILRKALVNSVWRKGYSSCLSPWWTILFVFPARSRAGYACSETRNHRSRR